MLPAGLPVPILAVIPVTDVAMILVPAVQRTIPAAKPVQLSAGQSVVTAIRHAQAAVHLIPEVLWDITNAAAPAGLVQLPVRPVLPPPTPEAVADQPRMNAEPRLVIILINHAVPHTATKPDALAALILVPMVAAVPENVVRLVLIPSRLHLRLRLTALIYVMTCMVIQNVKLIAFLLVTEVNHIQDGHS